MRPDTAYQVVHDELMLDGNARLNLATFVTTWMEPQAQTLMSETFDKNMIDKDEYPRTADLEMRCVNMLARLWNSPDEEEATGTSTTGSSEAAMLGGMALKWRWRDRMRGGQADRQAQHGDGHQRAGVLGEVLPLLGRRDAPRADGGQPVQPQRRGSGQALRREHDRRRADPRLHVRRQLRADRGDLHGRWTSSRPTPASTSRCTSTARRVRSSRRSSTPTSCGTSACPGCSRSTPPVTSTGSSTRVSVGWSGATPSAARRPGVQGQLPRRRDADLLVELLPSRQPDRGAVLQLHPPRRGRLPAGPAGGPRRRASQRGAGCRDRPVRSHHGRHRAPGVRLRPEAGGHELHGVRRVAHAARAGLARPGVPVPRRTARISRRCGSW